jgi:hypothetical protein
MRILILTLLLAAALAALAGDPAIKVVPVQHLDVRMLCDHLVGGLQEFMPAGVEKVVGILPTNSLLVKATDAQAMAQFEAFLATIDLPVPQVIIEVRLVAQRAEEASAFGTNWEYAQAPVSATGAAGPPPSPSSLRYVRGNLYAAGGRATTQSSARQIAAMQILVAGGGRGAIKLDEAGVTVQELVVSGVTVGGDGMVTMQLDPRFRDAGVVLTPGIVRARSGETMLLGGFSTRLTTADSAVAGPPPVRGGASTDGERLVYLYVTPTVVRADTTTPSALAPFAMPPPAW